MQSETAKRNQPARARTWPRVALAVYGIALALIAFWPVPVDSGAGGFLRDLSRLVPSLTYARIESGANVLLFIPLGALLALILSRSRYLVLPIALLATVTIESLQALVLDRRTASLGDIVANLAGACLGLLAVVAVGALRRRGHRSPIRDETPD